MTLKEVRKLYCGKCYYNKHTDIYYNIQKIEETEENCFHVFYTCLVKPLVTVDFYSAIRRDSYIDNIQNIVVNDLIRITKDEYNKIKRNPWADSSRIVHPRITIGLYAVDTPSGFYSHNVYNPYKSIHGFRYSYSVDTSN